MIHVRIPAALLSCALLAPLPLGAADSRGRCGTYPGRGRDAIWAHREEVQRRGGVRAAGVAASLDVGHIAVLQDEGDLAFLRKFLDLQGMGLQFAPGGNGFTVSRVDRPVSAEAGTRLMLSDDDSRLVPLPFTFSYFGQSYTEVFVNSDGNLTFGAGDNASTARSLGRFLSGPPRIAPLFADLDPSAGGSVTTREEAERFTVTWTDVPQWERGDKNTFQVSLGRDGRVDFAYDRQLSGGIAEGVVGVAPGRDQGGFTAVDFSSAAGVSAPGALAESFQENDSLDTVAVARKFYRTHGDDYQQLVVFTSRRLAGPSAFAYELTVKNVDTGLNLEIVDRTADFGSAGRLESFVLMDWILKYPTDLNARAAGAESTLSVLGQEAGHRWLTRALFRDGNGNSKELLGRDEVHWSFFMDTDASHLEGNDIEDQGGGRFKTVGVGLKYNALDQYLMGLRAPEEVPPFFFVRNPTNTTITTTDREPALDVTFNGTRRDVTIQDVIAAMGPRNPPAGPRPPFRQAFIYVSVGEPPDPSNIERVERIRAAWEPFFSASTDGRGLVDARLN